MKKSLVFLLLVPLIGCASKDVDTGAAPPPPSNALVNTDQAAGDRPQISAPIINDPGKAPETGGYQIKPENPQDEKYQAAPGVAGGG